ncbi:MAG: response regulator [Candidatus Accumulibacter sp.]|nr:response regulator [Accumulibacter sp.]
MNSEPIDEILVVDDTPANLKLLAMLLVEQGYRVRPASNSTVALRSIAAKVPDLILLDVRMPDMDGYTLCRQIKADPLLRAIPVIFISALNETADKIQGFAAGGVDYLTKPFEPAEVLVRVRTHLDLWRLQRRQEQIQSELECRVVERTAELAEANRALQQSEERLRLVIEATSDGVWDWDIQNQALFLSDRWYTMLGYAPGEFVADHESWLDRVHPDDLPEVNATLQRHFDRLLPEYSVDYRMRGQSGDWHWVQARGKVIGRSADGLPLRMVGTHADIAERKRAEARIQASLREKEVLLREIYHRVKNNLQVIGSLLNMQGHEIEDPAIRSLFEESADRIRAMVLVHEQLYRSEDLSSIAFDAFLDKLLKQLSQQFFATGIVIERRLSAIVLGLETAIPCGLIVNELVTNAFKHAFPDGRKGKVVVELSENDDKRICLTISDNGVGLPAGFSPQRGKTLGWQLMAGLVNQIEGDLQVLPGPGTRIELTFQAQHAEAKRYQESLH